MSIYFSSDTHFGHQNIIKHSSRPFSSVEEMDQVLIDNWNNLVKTEDTIYHLGDFSFQKLAMFKETLRQLNGQKHVILGNHDKVIENNSKELINSRLLSSIQHYKELDINQQKLILFHYGLRVWNKSHYGSIHLFGHSHGHLPPHGKSVDVGVDAKFITDEYRPVSLDEVLKFMKDRGAAEVDQHKAI